MLRQHLVLVVIGVAVDVADACLFVGEYTFNEAVAVIVSEFDGAKTFFFLHAGPKQIAIAVVVGHCHESA